MEAGVEVDAGICGFRTCARAISEDGQHVVIELGSECEKVRNLGKVLKHMDPLDAYTEISPGTRSRLFAAASEVIPGCCVGCAVPVALFKAMQVAAGLALPKDVTIRLRKEE
jgi:hypothetical protein